MAYEQHKADQLRGLLENPYTVDPNLRSKAKAARERLELLPSDPRIVPIDLAVEVLAASVASAYKLATRSVYEVDGPGAGPSSDSGLADHVASCCTAAINAQRHIYHQADAMTSALPDQLLPLAIKLINDLKMWASEGLLILNSPTTQVPDFAEWAGRCPRLMTELRTLNSAAALKPMECDRDALRVYLFLDGRVPQPKTETLPADKMLSPGEQAKELGLSADDRDQTRLLQITAAVRKKALKLGYIAKADLETRSGNKGTFVRRGAWLVTSYYYQLIRKKTHTPDAAKKTFNQIEAPAAGKASFWCDSDACEGKIYRLPANATQCPGCQAAVGHGLTKLSRP